MSKIHPPSIPLREAVQRLLKNKPGMAATYLDVAAEDATDEVGLAVLLTALRDVVELRGMSEVAAKAGMKVESLSRALSSRGNPTFKTFVSIIQAAGMKLAVTSIEPPKPARKKRAAAKKLPRKTPA